MNWHAAKALLAGAGRIFDFSGSYSRKAAARIAARRRAVAMRSDGAVLREDWRWVGQDLRRGVQRYECEEHVREQEG